MRRLKKKIYLQLCGATLVVLTAVHHCQGPKDTPNAEPPSRPQSVKVVEKKDSAFPPVKHADVVKASYHRILGVYDYQACFPDVQEVQIRAARKWGVRPVRDRAQAESRKDELVYVGSNPYYVMDSPMNYSIPYLVPRAADLLQLIGRSYLDSLFVKGVPLHRIIVTSVLRSEEDVVRLSRGNVNVSAESCHRFGTTFDIAYNRYNTVSPPGAKRRAVTNDTLKWILSEVLRDIRQQQRCFVKYELKQGCFHITTR